MLFCRELAEQRISPRVKSKQDESIKDRRWKTEKKKKTKKRKEQSTQWQKKWKIECITAIIIVCAYVLQMWMRAYVRNRAIVMSQKNDGQKTTCTNNWKKWKKKK